jgi:nucleoside-diphosphate-sugar epimerase
MARYFVTGATGFIGGRLARQLAGRGHQVIALARRPDKAGELAATGVSLVQGDVTEPESLRKPMAGADGVFHVAGWYQIGARDTTLAQRINIDGTRNVLEMMRDLRVPKGVYTSTVAVFGDTAGQLVDETYYKEGPWLSEYDRTKWIAHYEVADPLIRQGLPLVIVQPGLVYGPGDAGPSGKTLRSYLRRRLPIIPRGSAYCWGHVDDMARAHIDAMERGKVGESYIIAGPPHTLREALTLAERITGVPAPRIQPSPALLKYAAALMRVVERSVPLPSMFSSEYLRVSAGVTYLGSNAKARRELGIEVRPLETGLRETLAYELQRLHP